MFTNIKKNSNYFSHSDSGIQFMATIRINLQCIKKKKTLLLKD